jgi:CRISPR/Cas system-associated endonuclease Cas1
MTALPLLSYESCLKIRNGELVLSNQATRESQSWGPRKFPYDTLVADLLGGFVTFPALRWLAEEGVTVSVLDFNGWPISTILPDTSPNDSRRLEQFEAHRDPKRRYATAKQIVERKTATVPFWPND